MTPRILHGFRLFVIAVGLNLVGGGAILAGGYSVLREPSDSAKNFDPNLEDVRYRVPKLLLNSCLALVALGALLVVVGWTSSRRWREGEHQGDVHQRLMLASFVATGLVSLAVVVVAGRRSPSVWFVFFLLALCLITVPWSIRRAKDFF